MGCVWPVGTLVTDRVHGTHHPPLLRVVIGEAPGGLCKTAWVCPPPWMQFGARFLIESPADLIPVEAPHTDLLAHDLPAPLALPAPAQDPRGPSLGNRTTAAQ